MIRLIPIIFIFLISNVCFSAGTIQIDGQLHSFSDEQIAIKSDDNIYFVDKKQLTEDQKKQIKNTKINSTVVLTVNFKAVTKVETTKK